MPAGFVQQTDMGGWVSGKELFWWVRVYGGVAWGQRVHRVILAGKGVRILLGWGVGFGFGQDPEDSLIMGNEDLCTTPEKKSDEFINFSVEDLVSILKKAMTFSNPLFNSIDNFTYSDDESLSDEDVPEDNVKIYSNPLFEFDDEYISSDVNLLFDDVLENINSKDSYDSNLDESDLLVTPLSDVNKDECLDLGGDFDEIDAILDIYTFTDVKDGYHDSEGDIIYLESLLTKETIPSLPS
nr:hypothetical protein [Tanacetum cinerariifolium]